MFVLANFIDALSMVVYWALSIYIWIIVARVLISWVNPDPYNPIVIFLSRATEPVLYPIRKRLPFPGGIDISPLIVIIVVLVLRTFLVRTLKELALRTLLQ
jgi:YggT family protein